jgi:hypothetical protein
MCSECYRAYPESYKHIAGIVERRIVISFDNKDIEWAERMINEIGIDEIPEYIKDKLREEFE